MKLDVPFYKQSFALDCGPVSLKMVLDYFGNKLTQEQIKNKIQSEKSGATPLISLALTAKELGYSVKFFSTKLGFNPEHFKLDFYKKVTEGKEAHKNFINNIFQKCVKINLNMEEKSLSLNELLSFLSEDSILIVLIDWNIITDKQGYQGHIVPIVGYDEENVFVHQLGPLNPQPFMPIKKELFDKARKAKGTDEDIIVIYQKSGFAETLIK
jgi:hypothetical protein